MSVEEAWFTLEARIRGESPREKVYEARDRLILEVRAEMPCEHVGGDEIFACSDVTVWRRIDRQYWCRTCEARAQLQPSPEEARLLTLKDA